MIVTLAWHGDPALKAEVAARMRKHREADEIVQGLYQLVNKEWASGYKGCLIGCTLPAQPLSDDHPSLCVDGEDPIPPAEGWHARVEDLYGIIQPVGRLLDRIFESLPTYKKAHAAFAVDSIEAIPVGADLTLVPSYMMFDILADPDHGVRQYMQGDQRSATEVVIGLYARRLTFDEPSKDQWTVGRGLAYVAEASFAALTDAADAAACAYDMIEDSDGDDEHADWWSWAASRLLHHLANAPIPVKVSSMPKRAQITASQLRQGIGPLITLLLQGHEVVLTQHGAPVGVIRGWADADGPAPEVAPVEPAAPAAPPRAKPRPKKKESGGRTWAEENGYRTSHLKPTFSTPPE